MRTTRLRGRVMALALIFGGSAALAAPAAAECKSDYRVKPGDTLSAIAARCDTTLAALTRMNDVDPRALRLGEVLTIPDAEGADGPAVRESSRARPAATAEDAAGYRVGPGDTPATIAAELGISVDMLMAANEGIDPRRLRVGQRLRVPDSEEAKAILAEREAERRRLREMAEEYPDPQLALSKGEWRLTVDIRADDLAPGEPVRVSVSGDGSDWTTLGTMPADGEGHLFARARVPPELVDREALRFALERPWGDRLVADYTGEIGGTALARSDEPPEPEAGGAVEIAGKVVRGGGCALLVTPAGETFALRGDLAGLAPGARVRVNGATDGDATGCVGHAALEVRSVSPLPQG